MSGKKINSSKIFAVSKQNQRRALTFWRVIRYGFDSFVRNAWLSVAATAVMTITLLIFFSSFVMQNVLTDTLSSLRNKVDMSIYLKTDTTNEVGSQLVGEIKKLSSVTSARYISAADARQQIAEENGDDPAIISAINEATNKNPATIRVVVNNINDTSQLENFVETNSLVKEHINPDFKPSFAGERRNTIQSIGRAVDFAKAVGFGMGMLFMVISALIIFNTIRMAIFNRKEEIQMMKLIGAGQSFIRGPFLVESVIYGFIAALISTGIGVWFLYAASATLETYQITVRPTIDFVTYDIALVLLGMMAMGAVIGIVSSLLATRRYLKV